MMYLLAAPEARGLFSKAIAQSAYMISTPELKQRRFGAPAAEESGANLAAALHAPNGAEMPAHASPTSKGMPAFAPVEFKLTDDLRGHLG